jgi:thioredoxin reductase
VELETLKDCIVVGAGPSGLSAALFLARYHRRVLVFHHNSPRNQYAHGVHGFLGHDGIPPAELLVRGRREVEQYGGAILEGCVTQAERLGDSHFRVTVELEQDGVKSFSARRLLLATGLRDLTPDCPGFRAFYGRSVFHCPDCDGYEVTGKRVAVLSKGRNAVGYALNLLTWTPHLTLLTNGEELPSTEHERLAGYEIPLVNQRIARLEGDAANGRLERVCLENGQAVECDALFFNLGVQPASQLHEMLNCRLDSESGLVWIDDEQQTSVPGVYAAGDLTPRSQLAIVAAAEGAMAAIHLHKSLLELA